MLEACIEKKFCVTNKNKYYSEWTQSRMLSEKFILKFILSGEDTVPSPYLISRLL